LFRALAEAFQSRLTFIAGVRDDILPDAYRRDGPALGLPVPPAPPGLARRRFDEIAPGPASPDALTTALGRAGYALVACYRLGLQPSDLSVVKMFVPGLGGPARTRRQPK
jgi:ribosomal protein S12 methylthiotransferase accessory factor